MKTDIQTGREQIGQKGTKFSSRRFEILAKDFTSVEQAVPLRLVYGQAKFSGVQFTPIFGFRNVAKPSEGGGK